MSPSDHFMAAYVVVVLRFQFLFFFVAQVATKNRTPVLFCGVLNSICYLGCFLVLQKLTLLFCVVDTDYFSSRLQHQETTIMQCIIVVMSIRIIVR